MPSINETLVGSHSCYAMASLLLFISFFLVRFCSGKGMDTITLTKSIKDGETLNSTGGSFAFGFFSPGSSTNRYAGIWYNKIPEQTVIWVANRENPIRNSSGFLAIGDDGNLAIFYGGNNTVWSTNVSLVTNNTNIKLLNSGNLVLSEGSYYNPNRVFWQSFDYPTDCHIPGMKLGLNRKTGLNWSLTSWKSANDPAPGEFSFVVDPRGWPQFFTYKGSDRYWRSGPWTGQRLSGVPDMIQNYIINFTFVSNEEEISMSFTMYNASIISRAVLDSSGKLQRMTWVDSYRRWNSFRSDPGDSCDNYAQCGVSGSCNADNAPVCGCLPGFEPRSPREWFLRDGTDGCVRKKALGCGERDGFLKLERVKLPDTSTARLERIWSRDECERTCRNNCSCTGYAVTDVSEGGSGCVIWDGDLTDIRVYPDVEQDMYVRLSASELDDAKARGNSKGFHGKEMLVTAIASAAVVMILLFSAAYYLWRRKKNGKGQRAERYRETILFDLSTDNIKRGNFSNATELEDTGKSPEVRLYDMHTLVAATDNFSYVNKLGEGGFGPVYKGTLLSGREIAVKRLSKNSGQGAEEFKNEVILIAKLQHRNLVRLLGCCIRREEKILIYEYMPNKSLDSFIFDQTKRVLLDWKKRFDIILGIARGVLYLHQDSILTIIHRDLKASNILLDAEMNPKISDFGMARIFGGKQTQANTNRVVGTYGYMSPEYAMDGFFSVKSDVYSFGVLLLEIVTGKKNSGYYNDDPSLSLIKNIWNMWKEGKALELADSSMHNSCPVEVLRCIQVALLCVQESAIDRPTMSSVVLMLGTETTIPPPKQPAFLSSMQKQSNDPNSSTTGKNSINQVTISVMEAR